MMFILIFMMVAFHNLPSFLTYYLLFIISLNSKILANFFRVRGC